MKVRIKSGWDLAGKIGEVIGDSIIVCGVTWTPVLWKGEDDPDFIMNQAIEGLVEKPSFRLNDLKKQLKKIEDSLQSNEVNPVVCLKVPGFGSVHCGTDLHKMYLVYEGKQAMIILEHEEQ